MDFNKMFEDARIQARNYMYLNHYTSIDALKFILQNQSLMLNRIDKVDDLMEHERIDPFISKKGFVSCFTSRKHESYFFWKVYSHKEENNIGIRISFPIDILNQSDFYFDSACTKPLPVIVNTNFEYKNYEHEGDWGLLRQHASKVIYTDNLKNFCYVDEWLKSNFGDCVNLGNETFERNALSFIVKTFEWDNEEEIRVIGLVRPKGMETKIGKTMFVGNTIPQPIFDRIYVKLSNQLLEKCIFTISPFNNAQYEETVNTIRSYKVAETCTINKSVMSVRV